MFRKDWRHIDHLTNESVEFYKNKDLRCLNAINGTSEYSGKVMKKTQYGAAICNIHMAGIVGLACLFLSGRVPKIEQKFCRNFQKYLGDKAVCPPLEIDSRPLFYYIIFNLDETDLWKTSANELLLWSHGIGISVLNLKL